MSIESILSITAILISALSAIYSFRAVKEAKNANRISSHQLKFAIFQDVRRFRNEFKIHGESIEESLFDGLFRSSNNASLYFTKPVAVKLLEYSKAANNVLIARDSAKRSESINQPATEKWGEVFQLVDRCRALEGTLLADLESETKITN